jgi:carbonic anhydrase
MSDLCSSGQKQSPIHIRSENAKSCMDTCSLLFYYRSSRCNITRDGNDLLLTYDPGSHINFNGEIYELERIAFTCPSSHKIDSKMGEMEMMLFHKSPETNKIIALSVLFEVSSSVNVSNEFFNSWTFGIPATKQAFSQDKTINMHDNWNIFNTLPEKKAFYTYMGSTVKKPCAEGVRWIIMDELSTLTQQSYDNIYRVTGINSRKIQNTNSRDIFYNKNGSASNNVNKILNVRCITDETFREQCKLMMSKEMEDVQKSSSKVTGAIGTVLGVFILIIIVVCWKYGLFSKLFGAFNFNKKISLRGAGLSSVPVPTP